MSNLLFLLKKHTDSAGYSINKSGLLNSATLVATALNKEYSIESSIELVVDGNEIDKFVVKHRPKIVILEAIWCPPYKLRELVRIHKDVKWVVRVHSRVPFLANEGIAMPWMREYGEIPNVTVTVNSENTFEDLVDILPSMDYLPNIYHTKYSPIQVGLRAPFTNYVNIGCFGAIRPMKNQLNQALAAIKFADSRGLKLYFSINSSRVEQGGLPVLHNLRGLFKDTKHELVEHEWMDHNTFKNVCRNMDIGMQVSMSESFNIVCADFVSVGTPIIVSQDIDWMPCLLQAKYTSVQSMVSTLNLAYNWPWLSVMTSRLKLDNYNSKALRQWATFLANLI
jgi:hypothetical protein